MLVLLGGLHLNHHEMCLFLDLIIVNRSVLDLMAVRLKREKFY